MDRRIRRMVPFLAIALLVFASALPASADHSVQSSRPDGQFASITDITQTVDGQRRAAAATSRFTAQGIATTVDKLKTLRVGDDLYLVVPARLVEEGLTTDASGYPILSTAKRPSIVADQVSPLSGGWTQVAGDCFEYDADDSATHMVQCYKVSKYSDTVMSGGSPKDVYALHLWQVVNGGYYGNTPNKPYQSWQRSSPAPGSASMTWADWNPKSYTSGRCRPYTVAFSAGGVSVSSSGEVCETWRVSRDRTPGKMISLWSHGGRGTMEPREVAHGVEVYVPVGGWPIWNLETQWWWR